VHPRGLASPHKRRAGFAVSASVKNADRLRATTNAARHEPAFDREVQGPPCPLSPPGGHM
jgi:hypothetical protein